MFLPGHCTAPGSAALDRARAIRRRVVGLVDRRDDYVSGNRVDPLFAYPAGNWAPDAPNDFLKAYRAIANGGDAELLRLRAWTQAYSGFNLVAMESGRGLDVLDTIEDLDAAVEANLNAGRDEPWPTIWRSMIAGLPKDAVFRPAPMLAECGWLVDDVIVNHDTCAYQERVSLLLHGGVLDYLKSRPSPRVIEIGGGYGAIASFIMGYLPSCSYTIVDLPESLLFSSLYLALTTAHPVRVIAGSTGPQPAGVTFVPNYGAAAVDGACDLVINTLSFSEMTRYQLDTYLRLMREVWLASGGLLFEQNQDNRHMGLLCAEEVIASTMPHRKQMAGRYRHGSPNIWSLKPIAA